MPPEINQKWLAVLRSYPSLLTPPAEPNERFPADPFALVSAGRLTRFQYDLLSAGQGKDLILGNYVLIDKIGEGGMGVVYKARHAKLGRTVAVKVIRSERLRTTTAVRRFVREVRASAKLDHPLIVRALDADSVEGRHFLAMEYVDGRDLVSEVERGPLSIADALAVGFQVALALQHLYENGVVHRDLKPTNLIRDRKTRAVKVLDLGLSRIINPDPAVESTALTQAGTIIGTPDYMAPEQGQDVRQADTRSDLYSLGCTLYFLLSGRVPFPGGTTIEKILRHCQDRPVPIQSLRPDLPLEVVAVIERLMCRQPDDRFQTPAELIAALTVLGTLPPTPGGLATGATGSNPSLHVKPLGNPTTNPDLGTASTMATVVTTNPDSSWRVALAEVIARDSTISGRHPQPPSSQKIRLREYRSALFAAGGLVAAVLLLTVAIIPWNQWFGAPPPTQAADEPRALRDRVAKWLETRDASAAPILRADTAAAMRKAAGTADAITLAGYLKRLPSPLDKLPEPPAGLTINSSQARHHGPIHHLAVSADGKTLVSGGWDRTLRIWDPETLALRLEKTTHQTPIFRVAASRQGRRIAGASGFSTIDRDEEGFERTLVAFDIPSKSEILRLSNEANGGGWCLSAAFTADGNILAGQFEAATLWNVGAKGHKLARIFSSPGMNWCTSVAISADGKTAFSGGNHALAGVKHDHALVWDLAANPPPPDEKGHLVAEKPVQRLPGHRGPVVAIAPHADNRHVLTVDSNTARIFDYTTGKLVKEVAKIRSGLLGGCWSPGGKAIVLATDSGSLYWFDAASGQELHKGTGHLGRVNAVAEGAKHVFSAGEDGTIRKWDPATGKEITSGKPAFPTSRISFFDDDRKVVIVPTRGPVTTASPADLEPVSKPALPSLMSDTEGLAVTPDGTRVLLRADGGGRATVWDLSASKGLDCAGWPESADARLTALSPDGKHVLYSVSTDKDPSGTLRWTDVETGETVKLAVPTEIGGAMTEENRRHRIQAREATALAIAPDGRVGVAATRSRDVLAWDLATGKVTVHHSSQNLDRPGIVRQLTFGPIGRRVFAVGLGSDVWVLPLSQARKDEFLPAGVPLPRCLAASADDELLAIGSFDSEVSIITTGGAPKRTFKTPGPVTAVDFSSDGRAICVGLANGSSVVYKLGF